VSAPAVITTDLAPKKRRNWRDKDMCSAIHAVKYDQLSILMQPRYLAYLDNTLGDRISVRVTHGTKPGPQPYLTKVERI